MLLFKRATIIIAVITFHLAVAAPACWAALSAPTLKWSRGGCYSSWCETGWYSSPALVDINNDGIKDVIASAYSVFALNGLNGNLFWRAGNTNNRTWPGVLYWPTWIKTAAPKSLLLNRAVISPFLTWTAR